MNNLSTYIAGLEQLKDKNLYVACSGGLDSMVLLTVVSQTFENVKALHINYGLRGQESDQDELFVRQFCQENNISVQIKKSRVYGKSTDENIQLMARTERYKWFKEIVQLDPMNRVLVAHHADDQVETFFMNLIRKSGVMGLSGMPFEKDGIIRPLLRFRRSDLTNWAETNELVWREDSSNQSLKYVRNSWRNAYIPLIEQEIPEIREEVLLLIDKFQKLQVELESKVRPTADQFKRDAFIDDVTYQNMNALEKVEFWRQLDQPPSTIDALEKLSQKGKIHKLKGEKEGKIVRETSGYSLSYASISVGIPSLIITDVETLPATFDLNSIYLDKAKIKGNLTVRKWRHGDRIKPAGMNGSTLISDVISDHKLDIHQKEDLVVICDDEEILWCPGLKVGRTALASSETVSIIRVQISD